jgi:hypothetical protein
MVFIILLRWKCSSEIVTVLLSTFWGPVSWGAQSFQGEPDCAPGFYTLCLSNFFQLPSGHVCRLCNFFPLKLKHQSILLTVIIIFTVLMLAVDYCIEFFISPNLLRAEWFPANGHAAVTANMCDNKQTAVDTYYYLVPVSCVVNCRSHKCVQICWLDDKRKFPANACALISAIVYALVSTPIGTSDIQFPHSGGRTS